MPKDDGPDYWDATNTAANEAFRALAHDWGWTEDEIKCAIAELYVVASRRGGNIRGMTLCVLTCALDFAYSYNTRATEAASQ